VIVVVVPVPWIVTPPGDLVSVQVPVSGKPVRETEPVDTVQSGWVMAPTPGAGCPASFLILFLFTEKFELPLFEKIISGLLSRSISATASPNGNIPALKSILSAKDVEDIEPEVLLLHRTEIVLLIVFVIARSGFPFPSISPMLTLNGPDPVVKSTLSENEPALISPEVPLFLRTDKVFEL
jgi:hypothetical protein